MGLTKSLLNPFIEEIGQRFGKEFVSEASSMGVYLNRGLPVSDIPGLSGLAKSGPIEVDGRTVSIEKWWEHSRNFVEHGEQGAGIEALFIQDEANKLVNKQQIDSNTLALRHTNPQAQLDITGQIEELDALRVEGEKKLKTRGGQDPGSSTLSTGPELVSGDKRIYQLNTKAREPYKVYEDLLQSDPVVKKFHHKFMKGQSVPYFERAWELVDAGKATKEDIIALHRYALDAGVGTGDRQSAIMMFERIPHDELHNFMLDIGIQPSATKFAKESVSASGRKTRVVPSSDSPLKRDVKRIKKLETIEDLATDFKQAVDEIAVPMTKEAELLQEAWQAVDIQLRDELMDTWNKRNTARKIGDKELANTLHIKYKKLKKEAIKQMKENRAKYGQELGEYGRPDPESYGRAEIRQELQQAKQERAAFPKYD